MKIAFKLYFLCEIWTRILFYRWNYVNNYYLFESCMIIWQNIWVWLCLHPILEVDKSGHTKVDMWDKIKWVGLHENLTECSHASPLAYQQPPFAMCGSGGGMGRGSGNRGRPPRGTSMGMPSHPHSGKQNRKDTSNSKYCHPLNSY